MALEQPKFNHFLYEERGPVAVFTANRPEVMNAINHACQEDLVKFALWLEEAEHLRCAVITGAGDKAFVAGADINNLRSGTGLTSYKNGNMRRAFSALESCSKPVICAVNGWAMGGGFELALACDVRIASENARFGFPETDLGVLPGECGTQRLARFVGLGVAKDVILAGRVLTAQEAYNYGLVMQVVPRAELLDAALKTAGRMLKKGPLALEISKKLLNPSRSTDMDSGVFMESLGLAVLMGTRDKQEGASAFLEKRTPEFTGE